MAPGSELASEVGAGTVVCAAARRDRIASAQSAHSEQTDQRMHSLAEESWTVVLALEAGLEPAEEQTYAHSVPEPALAPAEAEMLLEPLESHLEAESESSALRDPRPHQDPQRIHLDPCCRIEPRLGRPHGLQALRLPLAVP